MPIFSWSLSFLRPYRVRVIAIVLLAMVEIGLAALAPWPMKAIVDNVFGGRPFPGPLATVADTLTNGSVESLLILVALSGLGLQLLLEVVRGAHTQFAVDTGQRIVYDLRARLLTHLQALPLRHHVLGRTADSVYRLESDAYCVNDLVIGGVFPLTTAALKLAVMFVILMRLDPTLGLLSLAVAPFLYVALRYYSKTMTDRAERVKAAGVDARRAGLRDPVVDRRDQELRARAPRAGALQQGGRRDDDGAAAAHVAGVAVLAVRHARSRWRARRSCWSSAACTCCRARSPWAACWWSSPTWARCTARCRRLRTPPARCSRRASAPAACSEMFALTPEALDVAGAIDASGIVGDVVLRGRELRLRREPPDPAGHQLRRATAARWSRWSASPAPARPRSPA